MDLLPKVDEHIEIRFNVGPFFRGSLLFYMGSAALVFVICLNLALEDYNAYRQGVRRSMNSGYTA